MGPSCRCVFAAPRGKKKTTRLETSQAGLVPLPGTANCDVGVLFLVRICLKALWVLLSFSSTGTCKEKQMGNLVHCKLQKS